MATIVLSAVGAAAGASLGGGVLGLSSVVIGRAVGATLGRVIDQSILGGGSEPVETGRVDRLRLTGAGSGSAIPRVFGRMRVGGQVIWCSDFVEDVNVSGGGGKGAPKAPEVREYSYSVSLALGLCEGVIGRVGRIWADGQEIEPGSLTMRVYDGGADQQPDPRMQAELGPDVVPAYRGLAYVVIEDLALGRFGNRIPQFSFEVIRPEQADADGPRRDLSSHVRAVAMMPGTGEYALATTPVRIGNDPGTSRYANVNTPTGQTDFAASLDALTGELPRCAATSLVVSWFGNDLRCDRCEVRPKVDQAAADGQELAWRAGGIGRSDAEVLARRDGQAIYGGTPADASVIEAIRALRAAGQAVTFYPFILMDQDEGNGLPDPYGSAEQPALPWRGRITLPSAPGQAGSPDGSAAADDAVAAFFGTAEASDFSIGGHQTTEAAANAPLDGGFVPINPYAQGDPADDPQADPIQYLGPDPDAWGYRRFILHYAHLCVRAGGVDAFCIGSEMRGVTQIRGAAGFPAVAELIRLAADVRAILGPDCKISYAADWSEYFGYQPQDGSGDVYFHLDPLWASDDIDFIGIDNYMPLSDWRGTEGEADALAGSIYNVDYLMANVQGGEGYDWFYASDDARAAQERTPITDGTFGEPWVYRYKDLANWWGLSHHERIGGVRQVAPTAWVARSKPIWFTELGCAAIDKGTNQPNKFLDPKSSESALPHFSNGQRDDYIQVQYLRAMHTFWEDPANNPVSPFYGGPMVDMSRAHVWAWDARPFPAFPGDAALWADAANYDRGHWIAGRSSNRTIASVVTEICARAGLDRLDTTALQGVLRGYIVSDISDARSALQPPMLAYGFDAIERGGALLFRTRTGSATATVTAEEVAVTPELPGDILALRAPEPERVGRLKLLFVGADGDFDAATAEAVFPDTRSHGTAQTELPLLLSRAEGRAITERWLAEARVGRDRLRLALPPSRLDLGAGDVIATAGGQYRIDRVEQSGLQLLQAVRVEPEIYAPSDIVDGPVTVSPYRAPPPPVLLMLDLPLLKEDSVPHAPWLAASAAPWGQGLAVYSSREETGYRLNTTVEQPATVGVTETDLARAPAGRPDRGPALRVRLVRGQLSSATRQAFLNGANAMAIGNGDDDLWEILQFRDATLVGPGTWDLSFRLRGQRGTDAVTPPVWPAGSAVVMLNERMVQLDLPLSDRGLPKYYRAGPVDRPLDHPSYRQAIRAFSGVGLRPLSPVHLRLHERDGDLDITWTRRTRIDGDSWQGIDVPLGEETEAYTVEVLRDGAVLRRAETASPGWTYGAAERAADAGPGSIQIRVAQLSRAWGAGPFAALDIPG